MRWEIRRNYRPTTPDVVKLTNLIATLRNDWQSHVILVGHSQGTILGAQAIRALPALEGHPVNVANRCVAALALAPAVSRAGYGLDEHHVKGLLANGDIVAGVANIEGWERFDAPFSAIAATAPLWERPLWGILIHSVLNSYLVNPGLDKAVQEIASLHRECLPSAVFITLSTPTASLGAALTANVTVLNQNNRELFGREVGIGGPVLQLGHFTTNLIAFRPKDEPQQVGAAVTDFISNYALLTVPVYTINLTVTQTPRKYWTFFAAMNGPNGSSDLAPPPTAPPGNCPQTVHFDAPSGGWIEYKAVCDMIYQLVYDRPVTLPGGLDILSVRETLTPAPGEAGTKRDHNICLDSALCFSSAQVEFLGRDGEVIGRSAVKPLGGGSP